MDEDCSSDGAGGRIAVHPKETRYAQGARHVPGPGGARRRMMQQAPLIEWPDPLIELFGFVASFLAVGAVMFRLRVVASASHAPEATAEDRELLATAAARAAAFG